MNNVDNQNNQNDGISAKRGIIIFIIMIILSFAFIVFGILSNRQDVMGICTVLFIVSIFTGMISLISTLVKANKGTNLISAITNQVDTKPISIRYGKEKYLEFLKSLPAGMKININNQDYTIGDTGLLIGQDGNSYDPASIPGVGAYSLYNLKYTVETGNTSNTSSQNFVQAVIPPFYQESIDGILTNKIQMELNNRQFSGTIPLMEKKKNTLSIIFSIIIFIEMILLFFHPMDLFTAIVFIVITFIIYYVVMKKVNLSKILIKEIKARPDENMKMIIASMIDDKVKPKVFLRMICFIIAIIVPCLIFMKPKMMFEKNDSGGYTLRYYTIGVINERVVTIPEEYNGLPVTEIRGEVFKNVTTIDEVKLPSRITEIRGNTFQRSSITRITIPDGVTRIGAHAFHECRNLSEAVIPRSVMEIGSSAFRDCPNLYEVTINPDCNVNERAFKNSPTAIHYYGDSSYYNE